MNQKFIPFDIVTELDSDEAGGQAVLRHHPARVPGAGRRPGHAAARSSDAGLTAGEHTDEAQYGR